MLSTSTHSAGGLCFIAPLTECARLLQIPRETLASLFHSRYISSDNIVFYYPSVVASKVKFLSVA